MQIKQVNLVHSQATEAFLNGFMAIFRAEVYGYAAVAKAETEFCGKTDVFAAFRMKT